MTNNQKSLPIEKVVLVKEIIKANGENGLPSEEFCLSLLGMDNLEMLSGLWYKYLDTYVIEKNFPRYVWTCIEAVKQNKCSLQRNKVVCDEIQGYWIRCIDESHKNGFHIKCGGARNVESAVNQANFWELFYEILESGVVDEEMVSAMLSVCSIYVKFLYRAVNLVKEQNINQYGYIKYTGWIHDIVEKSAPLAVSCCEGIDTGNCYSNIKEKGEKSWKMVFEMMRTENLTPEKLVFILNKNKRKKFSGLLKGIIAGKYT